MKIKYKKKKKSVFRVIALSGTKTDKDVCDCEVSQQPPTTYTHKAVVIP